MASNVTGAMLTAQEALERHKAVLNEHLQLWQQFEHDFGQDPNFKSLVSKGQEDTLFMIGTCEELQKTLPKDTKPASSKGKGKRESTEPEASSTPNSKRRRINGQVTDAVNSATNAESAPVVDASGLFMIDSNPTNVDVLLAQNATTQGAESKKKKRRRSEEQNDNVTDTPTESAEQKSRKKRRRADTATKVPEQPAQDAKEAKRAEEDAEDEDEAHHQSFEAKVALRLKEKEEQRKKKAVKKRKRSSEVSTVADDNEAQTGNDDEAESSKKIRKPRSKKVKGEPVTEKGNGQSNSNKKKRSRRGSKSKSE